VKLSPPLLSAAAMEAARAAAEVETPSWLHSAADHLRGGVQRAEIEMEAETVSVPIPGGVSG